jgi:hypothetical protein
MPHEPLTLFSSPAGPAELRDAILKVTPDALVTGQGDAWSEILIRFPNGSTLGLTHDPDYYSGPGWAGQKAGMAAYFDRFPLGDRAAQTRATIGAFGFSLATSFEPDYDPAGDERLDFLASLADAVDGVFFSPSCLRDARFRVLVSASGEVDEDAEWPLAGRLVPADHNGDGPALADPDWQPQPPTAERVARRATALLILTARATLERDVGTRDGVRDDWRSLRAWAGELDIADEFEAWEREVIDAEPGELDPQTMVNAMWRIEGLEVLAWALGWKDLPRYDEVSQVDDVWAAAGFFDTAAVARHRAEATLRPAAELDAFRKQMLGYHWRLRDFRALHPTTMDFAAFAADCWFGSFDLTPFDLVDGDLALRGVRIDRADDGVVQTCASICLERHLASTWLTWGPEIYSQTDTST